MIIEYVIVKKEEQTGRATISPAALERMAHVLKLLAHPHRLRLIEILERTGGAPVHALVARLRLPQGATSQHLNQMRRVGLVVAERRGREVWYRIGDRRALTILNCIRQKGSHP